jgi:nonsense-mediated mRNA decay protein 3
MKCIICDSKEAVSKGICLDCIMSRTRITVSGNLSLNTCPKCGSWSSGGRWVRQVSDLRLSKQVNSLCEVSDPHYSLRVDEDSIDFVPGEERVNFNAYLTDDMGFRSPAIQLEIHVSPAKVSCPSCNRLTGSYYESIIQIRSYSKGYSTVIDTAVASVNEFLSSEKLRGKNAFISKQVKLPEGFDLYLGSKSDGERISKYLHERFFSEVTQNKKLAGRTEGYDLYRYTYLVRILDYPIGSVLSRRGEKFLLVSVRSEEATLIDMNKLKPIKMRQNDFNANPLEYNGETLESRKYIVLSNNGKDTEVMDAENYSEHTIHGVFSEQEISGFDINGEIVIV